MTSRYQKQVAIDEIKEWYYNKFFKNLCDPLVDDYVKVRDTFWKSRIESGETTLDNFRKVWKRDIFDKDWKERMIHTYAFDDLRKNYGMACIKTIVKGIEEDICDIAFANDDP